MLKNLLKKSIALVILTALLFSNFSLDVFAKEETVELTLNTYMSASTGARTSHDVALAESINTQLKNFEERVDIYDFKILDTDENVQKIINLLSGELPECFHIELGFSISSKGAYISAIIPTYIYTKEEYEKMLDECDAVADEMLEGIEGNNNLNDVEKLLILHDRIALHCEYDYERYLEKKIPQISYSMYGVFVNGIAVCQGYALAYDYLLDRIGIENYYCASSQINHAWNIVYVNDKPYHVDITWDDIVWDITGRVSHKNFLVSTEELRKNNHNAYDFDSSPTDTTYDDYFWEDITSGFILLDDEIYYSDVEAEEYDQYVVIKRYKDKATLYKTEHYWMADGGSYWPGKYSRLSTDGKDLLFSLSDGIYKLNLKNGNAYAVHKPTLTSYFSIYGFKYEKGMLIYDLSSSPSFDVNTKKLYEYKVPYTPKEYTPGDIDDKNGVNLQDVVVLAQILAEWDVECNEAALDVNGDGDLALTDVVHLAQYVADWEGIELY